MKRSYLYLMLGLFLITIASASLPSQEVNSCVQIRTILNTTTVNISSISYPPPNNSVLYLNEFMTKNGGTFNYTFCDTGLTGKYVYDYFDAEGNVYVNDFEITPSGNVITDGGATVLFGSLLVMIIISSIFLFLAKTNDNTVAKISFYIISTLGFFMSFLYTVVTVQQVLFGFEGIVNAVETFLVVGKMGLWIGFISLMIIISLIMLKLWRIKRGLYDE